MCGSPVKSSLVDCEVSPTYNSEFDYAPEEMRAPRDRTLDPGGNFNGHNFLVDRDRDRFGRPTIGSWDGLLYPI